MIVKKLEGEPDLLKQVKNLWRANSRQLGAFPSGAFDEYASKGNILVAVEAERCIGYLLFREIFRRNDIALTHLCVDGHARNRGIANQLVTALKEMTARSRGIGLWCRRDYDVNRFWPEMGFAWQRERPGRGRDQQMLSYWWFNHGHPDLFTAAHTHFDEVRLIAALDASVFFDLIKDDGAIDSDSLSLLADWLVPHIEYCITSEILNEISRCTVPEHRQYQLKIALDEFRLIPDKNTEFEQILSLLNSQLPTTTNEGEKSDRRQLARAASGGADFFITRDSKLVDSGSALFETVRIPILRPSELVTRVDSLLRSAEYQPSRLRGTLSFNSIRSNSSIKELQDSFLNCESGERRADFQKILSGLLSNPADTRLRAICDADGRKVAILAVDISEADYVSVRLCRVLKEYYAKTIANQLIEDVIEEAIELGRRYCRIEDAHAPETITEIARQKGFVSLCGSLVKVNMPRLVSSADAVAILEGLRTNSPCDDSSDSSALEALEALVGSDAHEDLVSAEKALKPLKLIDKVIPSYIIPIEATWAAQLFDDDLANSDLFGATPDLMFRDTNVYYRSPRQCGLRFPARILWYVKADSRKNGTMAIRACSYLDDVIVDTAKGVFSRYQRFGVYHWRDILQIAARSKEKKVMALVFSSSERFKKPVPLARVHVIMQELGLKKNQFQSPVAITHPGFINIYSEGWL